MEMDKGKSGLIVGNAISLLMLAAALAPLLWIARYAYPIADDWSFGTLGYHALKNGEGVLGAIRAAAVTVREYRASWEGRFSIIFLGAMQPGIWGERHYGIVGWLMIGSIVLSELYLCGSLLKQYAPDCGRWLTLPVMAPSLILQLLYTPSPEESFYWYNGGVSYTFAYGLSLILLALFMKLAVGGHKNQGSRFAWTVSACVLAVMVGGDNYSTSLSTLLALLALSALFFCFDRRAFFRTWFLPAIVGACLLICATAPGNLARLNANFGGATMGKKAAIWESLRYALRVVDREGVGWRMAFMLLFILPFLWKAVKSMDFDFRFPLLFTGVTFGLYASQVTPSMYVERGIYAGRLMAILHYSCHVWIVGNVGYWLGWICRRKPWKRILGRGSGSGLQAAGFAARFAERASDFLWAYSLLAGVLFVVVICRFGGTSFSAYRSLQQGGPQQYAKEWEERLEVLRDDSVKEVVFPPISMDPGPGILLYADLQEEGGYIWVNAACAEYYDKDEIRIVPAGSAE